MVESGGGSRKFWEVGALKSGFFFLIYVVCKWLGILSRLV